MEVNPSTSSQKKSVNTDTFGFELLRRIFHDDIKKKEDVLILFVHWYFVKCGFRCVGIGDKKVTLSEIDKESELLPKDWNAVDNYYALRYKRNNIIYLLCGINTEHELLMNFVNWNNDSISNISFPVEKVHALQGSLQDMIPTYEICLYQLIHNFMNPICNNFQKYKEKETQTATNISHEQEMDKLLRENEKGRKTYRYGSPRVGHRDLFPEYPDGGMLFEPFRNRPNFRNTPAIGVPPPAAILDDVRYNPIGPPDLDPPRPFRRSSSNESRSSNFLEFDNMFL